MLTMGQVYGWNGDQHARGDLRRAMIAAHSNHVGFKLKRQSMDTGGSEES